MIIGILCIFFTNFSTNVFHNSQLNFWCAGVKIKTAFLERGEPSFICKYRSMAYNKIKYQTETKINTK